MYQIPDCSLSVMSETTIYFLTNVYPCNRTHTRTKMMKTFPVDGLSRWQHWLAVLESTRTTLSRGSLGKGQLSESLQMVDYSSPTATIRGGLE